MDAAQAAWSTLAVRVEQGVLHATLDRPAARNAMSLRMVDELLEVLARAEADGGVRAIVLRGAGGTAAGTSWLQAGAVRQQVDVTRPLVSDVSFKFLHHLDEDGVMVPATRKDPVQVDDWIADLNWVLGAQANVWFEKVNAVPVKVNEVLGRPVGDKALREHLAKEIDGLADVTVFLVGKWSLDRALVKVDDLKKAGSVAKK